MKNTLEKHKIFPIIAWLLFIGFAAFVFFLTVQLQATAEELSLKTSTNIEALQTTP